MRDGVGFGVLPEPSVPAEAGEATLDQLASGPDDKSVLATHAFDDLDRYQAGLGGVRSPVARVGKDEVDEGEARAVS